MACKAIPDPFGGHAENYFVFPLLCNTATPVPASSQDGSALENHAHSVALFVTYHDLVRVDKTAGVTLAMAANVTKRL
jgi:hypothetical protein